jgi:predicted nucleic acid-binding protein
MTAEVTPRVALDTNILVYAEGIAPQERDAHKPAVAKALITALPADGVVLPVQVLGELYRVLVGKASWVAADARQAIMSWRDTYDTIGTGEAVMMAAVDLATDHRLSIWDAVVLAAAAEAGCRLVLSEDMQPGFTWRGLTVVDPFAPDRHPILAALTSRPAGPARP